MRTRVFTLAEACVFLFVISSILNLSARGQALSGIRPGQPQDASENEELVADPLADKEPVAIFEVGASASWNVTGGATAFAPNLAVETTPIEHWLEIEAGVSPFYTRRTTEWDTDLLFKKPWTLSSKAEFMLGVGPEWVRLTQNGKTANSVAGELAGDFMFWPARRHRFGWFLEPAYYYNFAGNHQQSIGMSGGLLIAIP